MIFLMSVSPNATLSATYQAIRTVTVAKLFDSQHSVTDAPAG
jgi:hypothetical protein